jgi:membrane-associated protease RseP (regulator of RpoE activity)
MNGGVSKTPLGPASDFALEVRPRRSAGASTPVRPLLQTVHEPSGAFAITALAPGDYELSVRTPAGQLGGTLVAVAEGQSRQGLRIVVRGSMTIRGRLVDDRTGQPVPGVTVTLAGASAPGADQPRALTDPGGGFAIEKIPRQQQVALSFRSPDPGHLPELERLVSPEDSEGVDLGTLRLVRGSWDQRLAGGPRGLTGLDHGLSAGQVVLLEVRPGTPAVRAGLQAGDRLLAIDGKEVRGLGHEGRSFLLVGPPGSTVAVTVQGPGQAARIVTLSREAPEGS